MKIIVLIIPFCIIKNVLFGQEVNTDLILEIIEENIPVQDNYDSLLILNDLNNNKLNMVLIFDSSKQYFNLVKYNFNENNTLFEVIKTSKYLENNSWVFKKVYYSPYVLKVPFEKPEKVEKIYTDGIVRKVKCTYKNYQLSYDTIYNDSILIGINIFRNQEMINHLSFKYY